MTESSDDSDEAESFMETQMNPLGFFSDNNDQVSKGYSSLRARSNQTLFNDYIMYVCHRVAQ